jgi:hypothetical protein
MPHTLGLIPEQFIWMHLLDHLTCDVYTVFNSFAVPTYRRINGAIVKSVQHCGNYIYHLLQVWQNRNFVHTLYLRILYYSNNQQQLTPRTFFFGKCVLCFLRHRNWDFDNLKNVVKTCILTFPLTWTCHRIYENMRTLEWVLTYFTTTRPKWHKDLLTREIECR